MASRFRLRRKRRKRGRFSFRNVVTRLTTPFRNAARVVVFGAVTWLAKRRISRILPKRLRRRRGIFRRIFRR